MPDYVIIGGGVYGCGVAWEMARKGAEVVVLEAGQVAGGASGGLGKRGVRANGRDYRELPLMREAYEFWPDLHERLGGPTGYERCGHLMLVEQENQIPKMEAQIWVQLQHGIPTQILSRAEVLEMEPALSDRILTAVFCPNDGVADHTATTRSYARAAQKLGVIIQENAPVASWERSRERVTAVITDQGERIPVGKAVLLASNAHSRLFLQNQLSLILPGWTAYPQVLFSEPVSPFPIRHLVGHAHRTLSVKAGPKNRVMISGGWRGVRNPETGQGETRPDQIAGNHTEAIAVYPFLAEHPIESAYADRPEMITLDRIPIVDQLPGIENAYVATGWSGHGWAIAPALVRHLAAWLSSGQISEILSPFRLSRFGSPF